MGDDNGRATDDEVEGQGGRAGWQASLRLRLARVAGYTRLTNCEHEGPLRVQRAFYPEGPEVPHVYILHPPGGLAAGDRLSVDVDIGPGAHAVFTTPAAGKCYRSDGRTVRQVQQLSVGPRAALEWFPQENIVFDGARAALQTRVDLDRCGVFMGWDILCLGRPASGERFTRGQCRQDFEVFAEGRPLTIDRVRYDGGARLLDAPWGLGGATTTGTFFAWPASSGLLDRVRNMADAGGDGAWVSSTLLGPDGALLVCRYLGRHAARAREYFARVWSTLRPDLVGKPAVWPRIWAS